MRLKEAVTLWRAHAGAGSWQDLSSPVGKPTLEEVFWQDLRPHRGPMLEQSVPEGLHPMEWKQAGAVHEALQHVGRSYAGGVRGRLSPMGGTTYWSRGRM